MIYRQKGPYNLWQDYADSWKLHHLMDSTGGSSGGGVLAYLFGPNTNLVWVGDHYAGSPATSTNVARRLDAVYWSFITANSMDW